jgi:hypothetical protein
MAHGDAREEKWRGNLRMDWVASTLTLPRNVVHPAVPTLMRTPRLPVVDWTDAPADLNRLVRFGERRNLVSARVPSRFKRSLPQNKCVWCHVRLVAYRLLADVCWLCSDEIRHFRLSCKVRTLKVVLWVTCVWSCKFWWYQRFHFK